MPTMNAARDNSVVFTGTLANGANSISNLPGAALNNAAYLMEVRIDGSNVDQRFVYWIAHQGFGGAGFAILADTIRNFDSNANYSFTSVTVDSGGNIIITVTITSGTFNYYVRLTPVAYTFDVRAI